MNCIKNVKGFNRLTPEQQDLLIKTNAMHKAGVGSDYKDGWTPVSVKPLGYEGRFGCIEMA